MTATGITVGIIDPSDESREILKIQVDTLGLATVSVESSLYCSSPNDRVARQFIEANPAIILVDLQNHQAALQTLQILHAALPETWFFVVSASNDPQLIIETMRLGGREFFPKPLKTHQLSQAIGRFITEKQRRQKHVGKIYCFTGAKGGVGATTLSINVAASLSAMPNLQVSLIDLSLPVGDAAANLNLKPHFTIFEALASASRLDGVLLESFMSRSNGIAVLPSPKEFRPGTTYNPEALAKLLDVSAQTYSHTIIDLSSSLDKENLQVVASMASNIVVVLTPELPVLMVTDRLLRFLGSIGISEKLKVVLNRNQKSDEISSTDIEKALKHSIDWKLPNNYKSSIRAINSGHPVVSVNHSELASSYRDLAHWLAEIPLPEKRGLLGFLKR